MAFMSTLFGCGPLTHVVRLKRRQDLGHYSSLAVAITLLFLLPININHITPSTSVHDSLASHIILLNRFKLKQTPRTLEASHSRTGPSSNV
ncbi:hypothetical protein EJ05DRAFT_503272 [Pseudovirgaria hyperparasitica]|uniref:Uncharacterized protein n=1 Tax=Pseudovirgaria hyperparasitica TaxID=470096 RepID=A0A6A6VYP4_9PEZI|nr:uncharacterized protein EJ05DRAFT_503272 [Pseudovirgaria hyperparasitica]KAF2754956.1 hypothetical protein EJ05DRAFT_503272 [Pseudovirgaria hyperparasitica]